MFSKHLVENKLVGYLELFSIIGLFQELDHKEWILENVNSEEILKVSLS